MKNTPKPFGLEFLTEVEQQKVNGGRHRHHHPKHPHPPHPPTPTPPAPPLGGGTFHTMAISMPSTAHPQGDSF